MKMITIEHVSKVFGKNPTSVLGRLQQGESRETIQRETQHIVSLSDISLEIHKGEIFILMGLSGSGKSTLLRCINALIRPTEGKIIFHHQQEPIELNSIEEDTLRQLRQKHISMVFQKYALMPWRTLRQNVAFGLEIAKVSKEEALSIADQKLELVGLGDWKNRYPSELSGGMQQRVGLARALATDADILLLDEPFSALDPLTRLKMQEELLSLQKKLKKTMIFVSHDLDEALKLGSRIAILESGKVIQVGTPEEIVTHPSSEYVRNFVLNVNPQHVLRCETLMCPTEKLLEKESIRFLDLQQRYSCSFENGLLHAVLLDQKALQIQPYHSDLSWDSLTPETILSGLPELSMKIAIQANYFTKHPFLVMKEGKLMGVVGSQEVLKGLLLTSMTEKNEGVNT